MILGTEGSEFVVTDGKGVYKTGEQIITSKVTTSVGEAATTEIRNISFNDESAIALPELRSHQPTSNKLILVIGHKLQFVSITLLKDQFAVGTVEVKIVQPKFEGF